MRILIPNREDYYIDHHGSIRRKNPKVRMSKKARRALRAKAAEVYLETGEDVRRKG